jgi:hypothetical protein
MNKLTTAALATVIPLSLIQVAWAADKPQISQQGTATYVTYYTSRPLANLDMGESGSQALVELLGGTRNTGGSRVFVNMGVRCLLYSETVGGKSKASGACTETDSDGDKVFTTFDSGAHTLIGGTGKYKGISGTAPYTFSPLPAPGQGLGASVVEHKVTWQFK